MSIFATKIYIFGWNVLPCILCFYLILYFLDPFKPVASCRVHDKYFTTLRKSWTASSVSYRGIRDKQASKIHSHTHACACQTLSACSLRKLAKSYILSLRDLIFGGQLNHTCSLSLMQYCVYFTHPLICNWQSHQKYKLLPGIANPKNPCGRVMVVVMCNYCMHNKVVYNMHVQELFLLD